MRNPLFADRIRLAALVVVTLGAAGAASQAASDFHTRLDLIEIRLAAVQNDGRVKTFDSLAREMLKLVDASGRLIGDDASFAYLDLVFNAEAYADRNIIYIKKPAFRRMITSRLREASRHGAAVDPLDESELRRIETEGTVSRRFLDRPDVRGILAELDRDVMRTAKEVDKLLSARNLTDATVLENLLRVIPPPAGENLDAWHSVRALSGASLAPRDDVHASLHAGAATVPGLDDETADRLRSSWRRAGDAWRRGDAGAATAALSEFAAALADVEPALYPSLDKRRLEQWYYQTYKMTWTWIPYLLAVVFLLMALVYRWRWARRVGLILFLFAFALHTTSLAIRWYLAGRIPNANMFEAVTASAWFGAGVALLLEFLFRNMAVRNLPALGASVCGMFAMMAGYFMPVRLSSDITTVTPVLDNTIWLYIHTNLVIASYALITIAATSAVLYLLLRALHGFVPSRTVSALWEGREGAGAVSGGAAALILSGTSGRDDLHDAERAGLAKVLDGATMIFMELAFITLWVGIILGAVWADVSWGRPWGWDPKEVFALNTWLIFLILVHVRMKVRDKAFWTAVLAVTGFGVMLFNWIAVNFVIVGLHSYA